MDYGIYKNLCNCRTARTRNELVKVTNEVWSEIKIHKICRVIKAWPFRVDLIVEELDLQIGHFSQ